MRPIRFQEAAVVGCVKRGTRATHRRLVTTALLLSVACSPGIAQATSETSTTEREITVSAELGVGATPASIIEQLRGGAGDGQIVPESIPDTPLARPAWRVAFKDFVPDVIAALDPEEPSVPAPAPRDEALPLEGYLLAHPIARMSYEGDRLVVNPLPDSAPVGLETAENWLDWLGMDFSGTVEYTCQFYIPKEWKGDPIRLEVGDIEHAATVLIDDVEVGHLITAPWHLLMTPLEFGAHTITIRVTNSPANVAAATFGPEAKQDPAKVAWLKKALDASGGGLKSPVLLRRMVGAARE